MKHYHYFLSRCLCMLAFFFIAAWVPVTAQGFSTQDAARLQQVMDSIQNDAARPFVGGFSAAIKVDELAYWEGATGFAARNVDASNNLLPGGVPFTTSTFTRIYSPTKIFTAVLVLELVKEGVLSLDDAISKYMPLMHLYNPSLDGSVTIRQLLSHESGYSEWEEEIQLQIAIAFDPTHVYTPYELMVFTQQLSPPGTVQRYSHNNFVFLGFIIEAATGRKVEELYRERFFEPLNLESIYLELREPHGNRDLLASPHDNISPFNPIFQFTGQPVFPNAYTNISALPFTAIASLGFTGGGLISDAADLATFSNALFSGQLTSPDILESLLQSIATTPDEAGNLLGYGIKNTPFISGAFDFIGHNGSAPGYRSVVFYHQEKKLSLVVLSNFAGVSPYEIAAALYKALPEYNCGNENKKEAKIMLCYKGKPICIDHHAAPGFIKKGATLGDCNGVSSARSVTAVNNNLSLANWIQQYPNPVNGELTIRFTTKTSGRVNLGIYDMNGKLVAAVYDGIQEQGLMREVKLPAGKLAAGMYVTRLVTGDGISQEKLVVGSIK